MWAKVKGKTSGSSSRAVTKTVTKTATVRARAEKKVYTLLGQKHDPPEEVLNPFSLCYLCWIWRFSSFFSLEKIHLMILWVLLDRENP